MRAEASAPAARPLRCFLSAGRELGLALWGGASQGPAHRPGRERSLPDESAARFFQLSWTCPRGYRPGQKLSGGTAFRLFASRNREVFVAFLIYLS